MQLTSWLYLLLTDSCRTGTQNSKGRLIKWSCFCSHSKILGLLNSLSSSGAQNYWRKINTELYKLWEPRVWVHLRGGSARGPRILLDLVVFLFWPAVFFFIFQVLFTSRSACFVLFFSWESRSGKSRYVSVIQKRQFSVEVSFLFYRSL